MVLHSNSLPQEVHADIADLRATANTEWGRVILGVVVVFALFHGSALALDSDRGQAGLTIGALVVLATIAAERILFRQTVQGSVSLVGLGRPTVRGLLAAAATCTVLLLVPAGMLASTGAAFSFYPAWIGLLPGLFAQAGIAEEVLFRGFLFRHVRRGRSFWRSATLSSLPFVAVHLITVIALPWPVAVAAVALAAIVSFPLAYLFELCGNTIWAPALVHFVIQAAIKVLVVPGEVGQLLPLVWIGASAALPWLAFLIPRPSQSVRPA